MVTNSCKILLIQTDSARIDQIREFLLQGEQSPFAHGVVFQLTSLSFSAFQQQDAKSLSCDLIVFDFLTTDHQGLEILSQIREQANKIPILVLTDVEDETLFVKAFQMGVDSCLPLHNLDSSLLLHEMRLVIERQQYRLKLEQLQQQQEQEKEFQDLEQLVQSTTSITARMFGFEPLRDSSPEMFAEFSREYGTLLELALEQRAFKVEHNLSEPLRAIADKLGFLKASPRDVIEIHTATLKEKNRDVTLAKSQAYVSEGRILLLQLMGYLVSFYRKYYIGLSNINLPTQPKNQHP